MLIHSAVGGVIQLSLGEVFLTGHSVYDSLIRERHQQRVVVVEIVVTEWVGVVNVSVSQCHKPKMICRWVSTVGNCYLFEGE